MAIDRLTTYGLFQTTLSNVAKIDGNLATLQNQISSGYKSTNFAGISANAMQYLQLEDRLKRSDLYLSGNSIIRSRVEGTSTALAQIVTSATALKNLILQRRNVSLDVGAFGAQITAIWQSIAGQLNTSVDGRYIFSGSRTDAKAVNDETFPVLAESGTPDSLYYLGDSQDLTARISDNVDIVYNARANDPGFQKIFAGLSVAMEGDASNSDDKLSDAYALVEAGLKEVITLQSKMNSNTVELNNIDQSLVSLQIYWKGVQEDIGNTDLISASTQVAINQSILQAAFQSFARITSLRLADFLR